MGHIYGASRESFPYSLHKSKGKGNRDISQRADGGVAPSQVAIVGLPHMPRFLVGQRED
jgi:hypothetical protein